MGLIILYERNESGVAGSEQLLCFGFRSLVEVLDKHALLLTWGDIEVNGACGLYSYILPVSLLLQSLPDSLHQPLEVLLESTVISEQ